MGKKAITKGKIEISVKKDMQDYSKEPAFVKSAERATAFLKKHGLPKAFQKKAK